MSINKSALNLLASYGSDSSDEEVPGSRVSTKRTHKNSDEDDECAKKTTRLPAPNLTLEGAVCEEHKDDPLLHDGRLRSFPHERGNWPTYVYVPLELDVNMEKLVNCLADLLPEMQIKIVDHFHISLTRTVVLKHHWIELFVQSVREKLALVKRFFIILDNLKVYCNEEKTRTFIGLEVATGYDTLTKSVELLNGCLDEFGLPSFYEDPSFHMSIAWCVGDHEVEISSELPALNSQFHECVEMFGLQYLSMLVSHFQCKVGNKLFSIPIPYLMFDFIAYL